MRRWRIAHILLLIVFLSPAIHAQDLPSDEDLLLFWEEGEHSILDEPLLSHRRIPETVPRSGRMASVIGAQELADALPSTALEAAFTEPGFAWQRQGGTRIVPSLRGLGEGRIRYLVDGIPLSGPCLPGAEPFLAAVDPFSLERIEILHGPGSVQYGSGALAGTIHLLTKHRARYEERFGWNGAATGRFGTAAIERAGSASVEANGGKVFGITSRISGQDASRLNGGGDAKQQPGSGFHADYAGANADFLAKDQIALQLQAHHGQIQHAEMPPGGEQNKVLSRRREVFSLRVISDDLTPLMTWSEVVVAYQELAERRRFHPNYAVDQQNRDEFVLHDVSGSSTVQMEYENVLAVAFGADACFQWADSRTSVVGGRDGPSPLPKNAGVNTLDAFGQIRYEPLDWISLQPGARYAYYHGRGDLNDRGVTDRNLNYFDTQTAYDLMLLFPFRRFNSVTLRGARAFRFPGLTELAGSGAGRHMQGYPNTELRAESLQGVEAGYRLSYPFVKGAVFGYYNRLTDRIEPVPFASVQTEPQAYSAKNLGDAHISGVEGGIDLYLGINWNVGTNHAYIYGQDDRGDPLSGIVPYTGNTHLRWTDDTQLAWVQVTAMWGAQKTRRSTSEEQIGVEADAYFTGNATLGFNISNYIDVRLKAQNLSDLKVRTLGSELAEPGINLKAQLDMHF